MSRPFFTKADNLPDVVLDLDDFSQEPGNNCLNYLMWLRVKYPKFKVTLFSIPFHESKDNREFFWMVKRAFDGWIELAIHGWTHSTPTECKDWDYKTAKEYITKAWDMGCFVKGFKAPGWQISRDTYKALDELDFWVADHSVSAYTEPGVDNATRRPATLKAYTVEHPWIVHGHTWNLNNPDPAYNNGIQQMIEAGVPWDDNSKFHFISEVV